MKTCSYDEMKRDYENGVYDFTKDGKCIACGNCCSNILPMSGKEIETIRRYIKKNGIKEQRHLLPIPGKAIDMTCPFLNMGVKLKCTIYEVRPLICREFCCNKDMQPVKSKIGTKDYAPIFVRETFFGGNK